MVLIGVGAVMGLVRTVRGPGRVRWAVALAFTVPYFLIVSEQRIIYARYLLPIVPALCVFAAAAVFSALRAFRQYPVPRAVHTVLAAVLTLMVLVPPAITAVQFDRVISRTSTIDLAYRWIDANIPAGATMVLEGGHLNLPSRYRHHRIPQLRHRSYEDYVGAGVEYLVASSQCYGPYLAAPKVHRQQFNEYMTLFSLTQELARITPSDEHPGPELRILKVVR
jgi:hypothetical protein